MCCEEKDKCCPKPEEKPEGCTPCKPCPESEPKPPCQEPEKKEGGCCK